MTDLELVTHVAGLVPTTGQRMLAVRAALDEVLRRFDVLRAAR
jgi:hypothetical protein